MFKLFYEELTAQGERLFLWSPVFFGVGIGLYFSLQAEPTLWPGLAVLSVLLPPTIYFRKRNRGVYLVLVAFALMAGGFTAAKTRTIRVDAPVLAKEMVPVMVEGRVLDIDHSSRGGRLLLDTLMIEDLPREQTPARVRVSFRHDIPAWPAAGDRIRVLSGLAPPSAPAAPGAYDFQRHAFFERIGAYGYTLGKIEFVSHAEDGFLENLRQHMDARIRAVMGTGSAAGVSSALITGERAAIDETDLDAMRASGLFHLLSISGLHMTIVAGFLFFTLRALLCFSERVALTWPVKKIAAIGAFPFLLFYLFLCGAPIPAQRAVLMTGIVLFAIVVDRMAVNLRLVAIAAFVVLVLAPESLMGPSFQMSFAAVVALIAVFEILRDRFGERERTRLSRAASYFGGIALSSVVAGAATAPYALFHFQSVSFFWGVAANMIAMPLTAFIVMPAGFIACLLMPLGLDTWPLIAMKEGVEGILVTARHIGAFEGSLFYLPAWPVSALVLITVGGLMLMIWQGRWRLAGLAPIVAGLMIAFTTPVPDILVSDDGKLMAMRGEGGLYLSSGRAAKFTAENWVHMVGMEKPAGTWPYEGTQSETGLSCDPKACLLRESGVSFIRHPYALAEDCARMKLVISPQTPVKIPCKARVIDRFDLYRSGAHAVYMSGENFKIRTIAAERGERPWVLKKN